jgi:hypothetical protein
VLVVTAFHGEETAGRSNAFTVESFQPELQRLRPHSPQAER